MVRIACLVAVVAACTPAQAPVARKVGMVMSLGGATGMIGTAATNSLTDHTRDLMYGFSTINIVGMAMFAAGELAVPAAIQETIPERNHRWAKILTERAAGAARDGRCPRVRRLEVKVRGYDREVHDFVFMRDPEIVKCLTPTPP